MQDASTVFEHDGARLGQADAAPVANEQVLVQLNLKLAHMSAQQRLRHAEGCRSFGETAQFGHAHKRFDLLEFHAFIWNNLFKDMRICYSS